MMSIEELRESCVSANDFHKWAENRKVPPAFIFVSTQTTHAFLLPVSESDIEALFLGEGLYTAKVYL